MSEPLAVSLTALPPGLATADTASLAPDTSFSGPPTEAETSSNAASLSSTPPTTAADSLSLASEPPSRPESESTPIEDAIVAVPLFADHEPATETAHKAEPASEPTTPGRARRARVAAPVYNLAKLSGTYIHGKRRSKGDIVSNRRRQSRNVSGATLVDGNGSPAAASQIDVADTPDQPKRRAPSSILSTPRVVRSPPKAAKTAPARAPRVATRQTGAATHTLATKLSGLGKRGRKTFEKGIDRMSRELRRLQDTNEFAHIDERPVLYTVWSKGKYVDPREAEAEAERERRQERPRKKAKTDKDAADARVPDKDDGPVLGSGKNRVKKNWLAKGLYAGQAAPQDPTKGLSKTEKLALAQLPALSAPSINSKVLPLPMFNGLRQLIQGRDFKLPWDVCNPLGRAQPKPDEWKKLTRSKASSPSLLPPGRVPPLTPVADRFVGDAQAYWRKTDHKDESTCNCTPEDGCGDECFNRIMLYECDESNCPVGPQHCTNRHFKDLAARTKGGGPYRIGVEVMKTEDRGYGVRANRCFDPNQIIVEYTGEIITDEECDRRMNEVYKGRAVGFLPLPAPPPPSLAHG